MNEQIPHSNLDPSGAQPSPEGTIAMLSENQRMQVEASMGQARTAGWAMKLEPGMSLTKQCNANYQYLNEQGVPIGQLSGALGALRQAAATETPGVRVSTYRAGGDVNPLTGETYPVKSHINLEVDTRDPLLAMLANTLNPIEFNLARVGIFSARTQLTPASCRAEEIIAALKASPLGRRALADHADPKALPIALIPEDVAAVDVQEPVIPPPQRRPKRGLRGLFLR